MASVGSASSGTLRRRSRRTPAAPWQCRPRRHYPRFLRRALEPRLLQLHVWRQPGDMNANLEFFARRHAARRLVGRVPAKSAALNRRLIGAGCSPIPVRADPGAPTETRQSWHRARKAGWPSPAHPGCWPPPWSAIRASRDTQASGCARSPGHPCRGIARKTLRYRYRSFSGPATTSRRPHPVAPGR